MTMPALIEDLWREQSCWSRAADRMKARIGWARLDAAARDAAELSRLAVAAEGVVSVENQGWMATLAQDLPEQHTAAS